MITRIKIYCDQLLREDDSIPIQRKETLLQLSDYIWHKLQQGLQANLLYICTHNSRRSQFGQIWAKVAASYFNIQSINTFSAGTETTAFNGNGINALIRVGFVIKPENIMNKPICKVFYDEDAEPCICYSKSIGDSINPTNEFVAITTCGEAETNCPIVPGVELRISTTYEDPKVYDGNDLQDSMYDARCKQIARECLYVFSKIDERKKIYS